MTRKILLGAATTAMLLLGGCFCGAGPGETEASLYLTDAATGAAVRSPSFTEDGQSLSASCQQPETNDPGLCTSQLLVLGGGKHTIAISAPGYAPTSVAVDTSANDSVHLAVEMHALP